MHENPSLSENPLDLRLLANTAHWKCKVNQLLAFIYVVRFGKKWEMKYKRVHASETTKRATNAMSMEIKTFRLWVYRAYTLNESITGMMFNGLKFHSEKYWDGVPYVLIAIMVETTTRYAMYKRPLDVLLLSFLVVPIYLAKKTHY